jgi:isocitrate dehydrogenase (NAD+)
MDRQELLNRAKEHFAVLMEEQLNRVERIKANLIPVDFSALPVIKIGVARGDGIGPAITEAAHKLLAYLLRDEVEKGKVQFIDIEGLTIENRVRAGKTIPEDVLKALKECHVILKGPTTTPQSGDGLPNLESANVAMRKELDLFANVRPVRIPAQGIDWTFFREKYGRQH